MLYIWDLEDKNSKKHNIIDEFQFVEMYVGLNSLMAKNQFLKRNDPTLD